RRGKQIELASLLFAVDHVHAANLRRTGDRQHLSLATGQTEAVVRRIMHFPLGGQPLELVAMNASKDRLQRKSQHGYAKRDEEKRGWRHRVLASRGSGRLSRLRCRLRRGGRRKLVSDAIIR